MPSDDIFLAIESKTGMLVGEANDAYYKEHLQVASFKGSLTGPDLDADKGEEAGQCKLNDGEVTVLTSVVTPTLYQACASGELFKAFIISVRKAGSGQQTYRQFKYHQVQIANISTSHGGGSEAHDTMSIKYCKFEMIHYKQNQDGSLDSTGRTAGWDADQNKAMAPTLPYKPGKK
ncbi:MAG TPA: type VI secretion system tube protein Hcp [Phycisphaerae bacterium]|jgi:type VI secretion system Hcp family effector|nr:type VI secretion system tube protein Hcp [Phycisphaerae bacterium]